MKLMLIAHTRLPFLHSSNEEVRMSIVFDKALKSQVSPRKPGCTV